MHAVYAGTVHLDAADRAAGTATLSASGRELGGQGSADANVTLRVVPHGATARVLISADLMIRGAVAEYAPGAIGDMGQRLVEQFAGNVEQLLAAQAGHPADQASAPAAAQSGWLARPGPETGGLGGCAAGRRDAGRPGRLGGVAPHHRSRRLAPRPLAASQPAS